MSRYIYIGEEYYGSEGVRGLVSYASLKNLVGSIGSVHAQRKAALNFDIALWAVAG
jgi:hypothetical protein